MPSQSVGTGSKIVGFWTIKVSAQSWKRINLAVICMYIMLTFITRLCSSRQHWQWYQLPTYKPRCISSLFCLIHHIQNNVYYCIIWAIIQIYWITVTYLYNTNTLGYKDRAILNSNDNVVCTIFKKKREKLRSNTITLCCASVRTCCSHPDVEEWFPALLYLYHHACWQYYLQQKWHSSL